LAKCGKNPESIMGDSFNGCIEIFRMHATADDIKGNLLDVTSFASGTNPPFLTISS
jgi:hypothetical protein